MVVAPAGAGVRETLITVTLSAALPGGVAAALTLALVSRLLLTVADVVAALVGYALGGHGTARARAAEPVATPDAKPN